MGLFGFNNNNGRGVSKEDVDKSGPSLYFDIFFRKFWDFLKVNLFYIIASIPSIIVWGVISSFLITLLAHNSAIDVMENANSLWVIYMFLTVILVSVFGTGAPSASMAYAMHNFVNDTHTFVVSDFIDNYKSNFLQATAVFVIDALVFSLCGFAFMFYTKLGGALGIFFRTAISVFLIGYGMLHMYIYPIMAKFRLKLRDIYRNALFLMMAKLFTNIATFAVSALIIYAVVVFAATSPIGILVMIVIYLPVLIFTQMFMINNVIKELLLKPSLEAQKNATND